MSEIRMECPSCAMMITAGQKTCPICGYEFPVKGRYFEIIGILLVILFLYLILF